MNPKPIVTILHGAADARVLARLRNAGYCVVVVDSHDDIRAAVLLPLPIKMERILSAAGEAIQASGAATGHFGSLMANLLRGAP